ncbi:uncharacterized protein LOC128164215 isoform X2 [Crassostrea angulata]|uniref:uncharacterized protein LOC128164215 isoform X2 n=1 Tax=Magallana angulata TaxID=2784310 RepID=UPI0022B20B9E|nr:uncharacterized protein LOC128164215 isoform X2 [Crassostrea angulata]
MVYAINGKIPGPEIVVTEGDVVAILVYNRLKMEGVTIHWHGLLHKGTPWMDGASMISQCPIMPGQVFEYRFIAEPVGTHWYHAHTGTMRNDGLSGAFIVLPKQQMFSRYHGEFFAVVQDWTKRSAAETAEAYGSRLFGLEDYDGTCKPLNYMPDETTSIFPLNVGLVNGRGRRYTETDIENGEKPFIPLETFTVQQMGTYRFRIMNVGFAQPFEVSFEAHTIYVVAMDGNDVEDQKCDAVVISPGETVDIKLTAKRQPNNYYINIKTIPTRTLWGPITRPQLTRAVLNYKGVNRFRRPVSVPRLCTQQNPCYVVNQIYGKAPIDSHVVIIPLTKLKSTHDSLTRFPVPIYNDKSQLQEFFLNFHLLRGQPAINGRQFMYPTSALQGQNNQYAISQCEPPRCTSERCRCTNMIKLEIGNVIQFVFFTQAHPVHFHGHQFHVLKIGFPEYDSVTGNATAPNSDIRCLNDDCTEATWANPRWSYKDLGLNLWNPPVKDTVNVPWGGYVVVRIVADNPGYWLLHCHLGYHQSEGMSLVLQEGDPADMVEPPTTFPTCNSFRTSTKAIQSATQKQKEILGRKKKGLNRSHQSETKRTSTVVHKQKESYDQYFHDPGSSNKAEDQSTNIWPQTRSKETPKRTSSSITPTFNLRVRDNQDTSFDTWPRTQSIGLPGLSSNQIRAAPSPVPSTRNELPTFRFPGGGNRVSPFEVESVSPAWQQPKQLRRLDPLTTSANIPSVVDNSATTSSIDNLISEWKELPSLNPVENTGSFTDTSKLPKWMQGGLPDTSAIGTSSNGPSVGFPNNNPFADTTNNALFADTSKSNSLGDTTSNNIFTDTSSVTFTDRFGDTTINLPFGDTTRDLHVDNTASNLPFGDTMSNFPIGDTSPFGDTTGNLPFQPFGDTPSNLPSGDTPSNLPSGDTPSNLPFGDTTSNFQFSDITSNLPSVDTASSNPFGDTTSNIPFSGITSNEPFFDSTSNIPITDTSSNAPFGELTNFYGSAGSTDPVLVQSPMRISDIEPVSISSGTGIPSSSLPGFSSGGGLPDSSGSSSFTDSGNLNEFFIG